MKEYKAVIYQENLLSSLVFGSAKINPVTQQPLFARLEGRYHGKRPAPHVAVFRA